MRMKSPYAEVDITVVHCDKVLFQGNVLEFGIERHLNNV
jgi:hypothetical protein